jgi:hypothetical protein
MDFFDQAAFVLSDRGAKRDTGFEGPSRYSILQAFISLSLCDIMYSGFTLSLGFMDVSLWHSSGVVG